MKIKTDSPYQILGTLKPSVETGLGRYHALTPSKKSIAYTLFNNRLHHRSPFVLSRIITIDPTLSDRYSGFVPAIRNGGTTVRLERRYRCYEFYLRISFEANVYPVEDDRELRYVSVEFVSQRLKFKSRRRSP